VRHDNHDPGNAERAITVGSTHRDSPTPTAFLLLLAGTDRRRRHNPIWSRGGEDHVAAAGANLEIVKQSKPEGFDGAAVYVEERHQHGKRRTYPAPSARFCPYRRR